MLYVWRGNLKEGKQDEYEKWVSNEYIDQMKKRAAPGWKFVGIYITSMSLGSTDVTEIWEFKKYADLDKIRIWDPVVTKLIRKSFSFFQQGSDRAQILREVGGRK